MPRARRTKNKDPKGKEWLSAYVPKAVRDALDEAVKVYELDRSKMLVLILSEWLESHQNARGEPYLTPHRPPGVTGGPVSPDALAELSRRLERLEEIVSARVPAGRQDSDSTSEG